MLEDPRSKDHRVHLDLLDVQDHRELKVKLTTKCLYREESVLYFLYCRVDVSACVHHLTIILLLLSIISKVTPELLVYLALHEVEKNHNILTTLIFYLVKSQEWC